MSVGNNDINYLCWLRIYIDPCYIFYINQYLTSQISPVQRECFVNWSHRTVGIPIFNGFQFFSYSSVKNVCWPIAKSFFDDKTYCLVGTPYMRLLWRKGFDAI